MGYWGTGISSNDFFSDVYDDFFDLYDNGLTVEEITSELISEYKNDLIDDKEAEHNFLFALAKAQWECKSLQNEIFIKVQSIIKDKSDLSLWLDSGATKQDLKKRSEALDKFLFKISQEKKTAKRRQKKLDPVFQKGDCIQLIHDDKKIGFYILESILEYSLNYIVLTDIVSDNDIILKDFKKSRIIIKSKTIFEGSKEKKIESYYGIWSSTETFKIISKKIELIGNMTCRKEFNPLTPGSIWSKWEGIIDIAKEYLDQNQDFKKIKIDRIR